MFLIGLASRGIVAPVPGAVRIQIVVAQRLLELEVERRERGAGISRVPVVQERRGAPAGISERDTQQPYGAHRTAVVCRD
jgi:hypothetical protein